MTTYIFDLDGTLLDTLQDLAAATNYALRHNGMKEHPIDDIRRFVGNGVRKLIERAVPEGTSESERNKVLSDFRTYYMQHSLDATRPYEGVSEMLKELKGRGCKMAVVSNKMMAATKELVAHFFPEIEVAIGETGRQRHSPERCAERQQGFEQHFFPLFGGWLFLPSQEHHAQLRLLRYAYPEEIHEQASRIHFCG